jgi:Protein of unknown function (DUF2778)
MEQWIDRDFDYIPSERVRLSSKIFSKTIPGVVALSLSASFGFWMLYVRPATVIHALNAPAPAAAPASTPALTVASADPYGMLFDPRSLLGDAPVSLAKNFPLALSPDPVLPAPPTVIAEQENVSPAPANARFGESVPLPVPRPTELASLESHSPLLAPSRRLAQQDRKTAPPTASAANPSFFDKLFGALPQPSGPVLAYAAPEDGVLGITRNLTSNASPRYDKFTAIYDIAAHTVYLPNGTKLEAHSGLRDRLDNPRYVNERMRGATPPNVYELRPRESLFHGVQALRLIPVGEGELYGRTGLLAHTFMLGPHGDSNGCVSFRNYNAFLQAYHNGEIKRLAVVTRLN